MHVTTPLAAGARREPDGADSVWFPHALDTIFDRVLLVRRTPADIRAASFLDDRSLQPGMERKVVSWAEVEAALAPDARRDAQYIFHISHVGSTLISRLLGEIGGILSLREPAILRTFHEVLSLLDRPESPWAPESAPARLDTLTALLSRTFHPRQRALIKATSFASELAPKLVRPGSRALLLYAEPEPFVAGLLAGEGARSDLHQLAGPRLARLSQALGESPWTLWSMSEGQKAAMSWLCEMHALDRAARSIGTEDSKWLDFDAFLGDPVACLAELAAFFGHDIAAADAERICRGPLMGRYSKGLEHAYSPQLRRDVLASSATEHRHEIRAAAAWLEEAARRYPQFADCLNVQDR
jgi:hypothetical protein